MHGMCYSTWPGGQIIQPYQKALGYLLPNLKGPRPNSMDRDVTFVLTAEFEFSTKFVIFVVVSNCWLFVGQLFMGLNL